MGWSETKALWRVPITKMNAYMHCHLYEEGAKVLSRQQDIQILAAATAKLAALCQTTS